MIKNLDSVSVVPSNPSPTAQRYSEEFKRDSVRLVTDEKYSFQAAATAVGVSQKSLRDWHAKFAPPPAPCDEHASLKDLREENRRLRQQLKRAEMERESRSMTPD